MLLRQLPHSYIGVESNVADDVLADVLRAQGRTDEARKVLDASVLDAPRGIGPTVNTTLMLEAIEARLSRAEGEDTTSSHKYFPACARRSVVKVRRRGDARAPALMRAVPKVSAKTHLPEALDDVVGGDTGAHVIARCRVGSRGRCVRTEIGMYPFWRDVIGCTVFAINL